MVKNVKIATASEIAEYDRLKVFGIRVRKITENDEAVLGLIDGIDLNIEYWGLRGSIYKKRIDKLKKLRCDLLELIA